MLTRKETPLASPLASAAVALEALAHEAVRVSDLAREMLRRSESRYRRLFESAQDGILLLNAVTAQVEDVNPNLIDMLGYSHEEFLGKKLWEVGPFADIAQSKELYRELQTTGYVRYEHLPLKTKTGTIVDVEFVSNSYDCEGVIVIQCNIRDISDRVRAERQVKEGDERFQAIVEQVIAGIYIIQNEKFVYTNPRGAEIVGVGSPEEVVGTNPLDWVCEADRGMVAEKMRLLQTGEAKNLAFDFGVTRRDGVAIQVGVNTAVATHLGRPALIGLLQDISEKKRNEGKILHYIEQLKAALSSTVEVATIMSEMRDPYTVGHERRVARIAVAIGTELGLDADRLEGLHIASNLHDVGKINIPSEILTKPGKLSAIEMQLVQGHAQSSYDILKNVNFPWPVAQIALQHHERNDGSGYPQGLKGEEILLEARILAVADVIESMNSHRPYRAGLGIDKSLEEIERGRGTTYDTIVADACLQLFQHKGYTIPA
jgi:PAS domain S-box-containing protein